MFTSVGIDLGGSHTRIAVITNGKVERIDKLKTQAALGYESVRGRLTQHIKGIAKDHSIRHVGLAIAGQVDTDTGHVFHAPNLGWQNVDLGAELSKSLGIPVALLNDVQAIASGEWAMGAGKGFQDMLAIYVGTGVGGGFIQGGTLQRGGRGSAGEIGHVKVALRGRRCTCGSQGCMEAYAGGWALAKNAAEFAEMRAVGYEDILALCSSDPANLTTAMVFQAFHQNNPIGRAVVESGAEALGSAIASAVNLLNPQVVVFGGGISEHEPGYVGLAMKAAKPRILTSAFETLEVRIAQLEDSAGPLGAAAWAEQRFAPKEQK